MRRDLTQKLIWWSLGLLTAVIVIFTLPASPLLALVAILWGGAAWYARQQFRQRDERIQSLNSALQAQAAQHQQAQRVVQLSTLNKVLALLTETLSPDNVLDTVISSASVISDATAVAVYLFRDAQLELVRSAGLSDAFALDPPRPLLDQQFEQPIVIENVHRYKQASHLRDLMTREGKAAWLELPLWVAGRGLGTVTLYFDQPQTFNSEDIELLRTFANQAAQAIQNAHLYAGTYAALETRIEQLSALATIGREIIATMDLPTISSLILRHAMEATCATTGVILLFNEKRDGLILCAQQGYPEGAFASMDTLNQGLTGRVLQSGRALIIEDVQQETDYVPLAAATRSQLSVPVTWRGEIIGVITLESDQRAGFKVEEGNFISQLANQMVIAVDNARLFQRVTEARDRMQAILDTMTEGIVLIDRWGRIALANPRVDLIGLDGNELIGTHINELLTRSEMRLIECMGFANDAELRSILSESSAPAMLSYKLTHDGKTTYILRQIIPVQDEADVVIGALLVFQDETEQRELEHARESFSRLIVHDLRSPLTAITSSIEFLAEMIPPSSEHGALIHQTANLSQRAIRKMLNRVNSLLDISRMQSGQLMLTTEPATLDKIIESVFIELNPLAINLAVKLTFQPLENAVPSPIDVEKIERVLLNLVDNALKFSPKGGTIVVRVQRPDEWLRVEVIDNGPGVPASQRVHIFDSFAQIKEQPGLRRGSGLGLTFCRLAVEAHGGRIWVEENPAGGSIFAFTLPLAENLSP